jgi:hypothetical protein
MSLEHACVSLLINVTYIWDLASHQGLAEDIKTLLRPERDFQTKDCYEYRTIFTAALHSFSLKKRRRYV